MSKEHIFLTYCSENKPVIDQIVSDLAPYGITVTHDLRKEDEMDVMRRTMKEKGDPIFFFVSNDLLCSDEGMHKIQSFLKASKDQLKPVMIGQLAEDQAYVDYWEQEYSNLRARKDNVPPTEKDTYNWRVFIVRKIRDNAAKIAAELKKLNYIPVETLQASNYHEVFNALGIEVRVAQPAEQVLHTTQPVATDVQTPELVEETTTIKDDIIKVGSAAAVGGIVGKALNSDVEQPIKISQISESEVLEMPTIETPVVETPVVEAPVVEAPVIEAPVVEAPVLETPVVEAPVLETPVVEAPEVEAPVVETPVVETPAITETPSILDNIFDDEDEDEDEDDFTMVKVGADRVAEGASLNKARAGKRQRKTSKWKGNTVLITGATSGIGLATAKRFAKKGFDLVITGRREHRLEEIKQNLEKKYGVTVEIMEFDVQNKEEVNNAIKTLKSKKLSIDLLINNAGLAKGLDHFHESSIDHWETMIDTNLKGLLYVTRAIAPLMVKRGKGHIINIGSVAGREVYAKGAVYCATKHAVDALTKTMRIDLMPHGIKVSSVSPGHVETEFSVVRFDGDNKKANAMYDGFEPLKADDVARTVLFIATQPAGVNIQDVLMFSSDQASATCINRKKGK